MPPESFLEVDKLPAADGEKPKHHLTLRKPSELLAMRFNDSDKIVGDRIIAKGQSATLLGAGGLGKSRIALQLAASVNTGRNFLALPTFNGPLRWFILQTENSNRRLQYDITAIQKWIGDQWPLFEEHVVIHTVESSEDALVNIDMHAEAIRDAIGEARPDVIVWDPLNAFCVGDLNKDQDMRETCMAVSQLSREGNPDRAIVVLHHALTGKAGAAKATGFDRASFGRNSKILQAWTRGQINVAPASKDNNEQLVFACGKCSNGKEFETFGARLNTDSMLYEVDTTFDVQAFESTMTGITEKPKTSPQQVAELLEGETSKADWAKAIVRETGVARSRAYVLIDAAHDKRLVHYSKVTKTYVKHIK
jgi:hypothetical protein